MSNIYILLDKTNAIELLFFLSDELRTERAFIAASRAVSAELVCTPANMQVWSSFDNEGCQIHGRIDLTQLQN